MKKLFYIMIIAISAIAIFYMCNRRSYSDLPIDLKTYYQDKKFISDCYVNNVEYYRLYTRHRQDTVGSTEHYRKYPYAEKDPAYFFQPYACRLTDDYESKNSPLPTRSQINVSVDTIIYNKTGNLFVAFVCIEKKYSKVRGLCDERHSYDGRAMIGYRDTINGSIKVYPLTNFLVVGMDIKKLAMYLIRRDYETNFKKSYLYSDLYDESSYKGNVGDKDFFEKSILFKKYDSTHYYFQLYKDMGTIKEYKYPYGTD